ncbi:unnamed protein product [Prunus armeniaca]|uniref:Uncharacterized protein n=1 Tax=Prunus armeniaca TaxID=36596 RepID=A0A6J5VNW6_PRUAR|nr:unnamed protein product [Prunus armeniaca]
MDEAHDMLLEGMLKRDRVGKEKAWNLIWTVSSSNSRIDFGNLKGFLEIDKEMFGRCLGLGMMLLERRKQDERDGA